MAVKLMYDDQSVSNVKVFAFKVAKSANISQIKHQCLNGADGSS